MLNSNRIKKLSVFDLPGSTISRLDSNTLFYVYRCFAHEGALPLEVFATQANKNDYLTPAGP